MSSVCRMLYTPVCATAHPTENHSHQSHQTHTPMKTFQWKYHEWIRNKKFQQRKWLATPKRARIAHWSFSRDRKINMQLNTKHNYKNTMNGFATKSFKCVNTFSKINDLILVWIKFVSESSIFKKISVKHVIVDWELRLVTKAMTALLLVGHQKMEVDHLLLRMHFSRWLGCHIHDFRDCLPKKYVLNLMLGNWDY